MARQTRSMKQENKKKDRPVMWTDVTGVMRLYGAEFTTKNHKNFIKYSTSLGRKNEDGVYDNYYLPVFFPKNDDPGVEGSFKIVVTKGFLTLNVYDKGKNAEHVIEPAIMVQGYEFIDDEQEDDEDKPF